MAIAVEELLKAIEQSKKSKLDVKCAVIGLSYDYPDDDVELILRNPRNGVGGGLTFKKVAILKENWSNDDWLNFLEALRFNYDDGYGSQHLFGAVWFKGGSWLERREYDGLEWWEYQATPTIPTELMYGKEQE